jgi:IS5 family transposase
MFKQSIGGRIDPALGIDADSGYQGIQKIHKKSRIPKRSSKKHPLTKKDKEKNRRISKKRIVIEHINAQIKVFKIFTYPYRNHLRRHLLRISLVCGIINFEHHLRG